MSPWPGADRVTRGPLGRAGAAAPPPGTYTYPDAGVFAGPGRPEGFTLWAFVFNAPEECQGPCDLPDLGNPDTKAGAFLVTGHMVGGRHLALSGQISTEDEPFRGAGVPMEDPLEVAVLLAVAPHGGLAPDLMPDQIKEPTWPPAVWWLALLGPPA